MKFTRAEELALLFISELASSSGMVSIRFVAERHGVSPLFLKKITTRLKKAHLIESHEGVGGGYQLSIEPQKITVFDVLMAVSDDPQMNMMQGVAMKRCPLVSVCIPEVVRKKVWNAIGQSLGSMSIKQLLKNDKETI